MFPLSVHGKGEILSVYYSLRSLHGPLRLNSGLEESKEVGERDREEKRGEMKEMSDFAKICLTLGSLNRGRICR